MNKHFLSFVLGGALMLSPLTARAQNAVGSIISYQGQLSDAAGKPIANGNTSLTFKIYEAGIEVSSQTMSVATVGGVFNTFLSVGALSFDPAKAYELGITFNGMETRQPIAAVPVALTAKSAAGVSGVVPVANGGTGSTTQPFVDLTTAQTIAGAKTFGSAVTAPGFNIGSSRVLGAGSNGRSVFLGQSAGASNGNAAFNVLLGAFAGQLTTGGNNTFVGADAGGNTTTGALNTALGNLAGTAWTTGSSNIAIGNFGAAGESATTRIGATQTRAFIAGIRGTTGLSGTLPVVVDGSGQLGTAATDATALSGVVPIANGGTGSSTQNFVDLTSAQTVAGAKTFSAPVTAPQVNIGANRILGVSGDGRSVFVGPRAGAASGNASFNVLLGADAGVRTTGQQNVFAGDEAGLSNTTGSNNTALGDGAGYNWTTGNGNIAIKNPGVPGESDTTRIGDAQTRAFIAGISGIAVTGSPVVVSASGQLGTGTIAASSLSGVVPVANGGTGSSTQNFVDLTSAQSVSGAKTFGSAVTAPQFNIGANRILGVSGDGRSVFLGAGAGAANGNPFSNVLLGGGAGRATTGNFNVFVGGDAGGGNTSGSGNTALGESAGFNWTTGIDNIAIRNVGVAGDDRTTRIGNAQTRAFIAGIRGAAVAGSPVIIDSNGQLGTVNSSSARFKQDVQPLGAKSDWLLKLRPVSFRYTPQFLKSAAPSDVQYGLIAEEVAKVAPGMVHLDAQGRPDGVDYQSLPVMLLNQLQQQQKEIELLQARLKQLEGRR